MSENLHDVTDASFETEVKNAELPVLLDLWAPWCGPCRMVAPVLEALADENAGSLKVCKLNVDENPDTAAQLGVSAIPTVVLLQAGQEVQRFVGVQPKAAYQRAIDGLEA